MGPEMIYGVIKYSVS